MTKFKNKYRNESNRHRYADYSAPGGYFITICTHNRDCIFGKVIDGRMELSELGKMVHDEMNRIPTYHPCVQLPACVVMPDHVHMILKIINDHDDNINVRKIHEFSLSSPQSSPWWHNPDYKPTIDEIKQYRKQRRKMIIPKIIGKFKMITSKQINEIRATPGNKNWQSNYHDHIIRNDGAYQRIKQYIINNTLNWDKDK